RALFLRVMPAKDLGDLGPSEFCRQVSACPQNLADLPTSQLEAMLRWMRAGAGGSEAAAGAAKEGRIEFEGDDAELLGLELFKQLLRLKGTVEAPHARVIASDDQVRDPVVLPDQGVEDRLSRPGVAHRSWECGEQGSMLGVVLLEQQLVRVEA